MPNFKNLDNLLNMDFKQMRGLQGAGGMRATDVAIQTFVTNLNEFYSQFDKSPTKEDLITYAAYMTKITNKINESEYAYYLGKYIIDYPEHASVMASHNTLKSFKDIPARMQFWAASETFGGTIRNAENHINAVKNLDKWSKLINQNSRIIFFKPQDESKAKDDAKAEFIEKKESVPANSK